jgi:hypothetical protein
MSLMMVQINPDLLKDRAESQDGPQVEKTRK